MRLVPLAAIALIATVANQNVRVQEVHLLGLVPDGVDYTVGPPKIRNDAGSARLIGLEAYTLWRAKQLAPAVDASVADQEDAWVITMSAGETRVFEVTVTKSDGAVRTKPLARWVPLSDE